MPGEGAREDGASVAGQQQARAEPLATQPCGRREEERRRGRRRGRAAPLQPSPAARPPARDVRSGAAEGRTDGRKEGKEAPTGPARPRSAHPIPGCLSGSARRGAGAMTLAVFFGCAFVAFGPALALFLLTVAADPLRIIILIAG